MRVILHLLFIFVFLSLVHPLSASEPDKYRIVQADAVSHGSVRQELSGNVIIEFGDIRLSAGRMVYNSAKKELKAWEDVKVIDPAFNLYCGRLNYSLKKNEAVAWGNPRLVFLEGKDQQKVSKTVLTGVQIWIFSKEQRVQVFEDVCISKYEAAGSDDRGAVEFRVRCTSMESLRRVRRTTFKGNVTLETPTVGATASKGIYDQLNSRFYLLGNSKAWNYSLSGDKVNSVEGDKIVYFLKEKKTVVIGNVVADVLPDVKTGERVIPHRVDNLASE